MNTAFCKVSCRGQAEMHTSNFTEWKQSTRQSAAVEVLLLRLMPSGYMKEQMVRRSN